MDYQSCTEQCALMRILVFFSSSNNEWTRNANDTECISRGMRAQQGSYKYVNGICRRVAKSKVGASGDGASSGMVWKRKLQAAVTIAYAKT
jgi:hypothetical protein